MTSSTPRKILLLEDDKDISAILSIFLESEGYKVLTAGNGLEALDLVKQSGFPDLIILDIMLPKMCGRKFISEFRRLYGQKMPIIVMTGAQDADEVCKEFQAAGWIEKPFKLDELLSIVKGHLN